MKMGVLQNMVLWGVSRHTGLRRVHSEEVHDLKWVGHGAHVVEEQTGWGGRKVG